MLLASMLLGTIACGDNNSDDNKDTTSDDTTTAEVKEEGYQYYGDTNFEGETFTIYNVKPKLWNMLCVVQPEEVTGETVNDAIYNRNERVKKRLNCEIEEVAGAYDTMASDLQTLILADEDVYDAVYMPMFKLIDGLTSGYYHCLSDVDTIHLEEDYWDQVLLADTSLNHKNYFATSSAHLMGWDGLWCLFFNESMMDDLQLEYPYQIVKDGNWTLDKMAEYCKAAANLNGDDSFALSATGNSVYGCVSFNNCIDKFIFGFGVNYVEKDSDDLPVLACESEKFINAVQKFAQYNNGDGAFMLTASAESSLDTYYQNFYENQRALFLEGELKTSQLLRDMEQSFGILPNPKIDDDQENYRSTSVHQCAVFTIPITNANPEKVGLLFDALSYESDKTVVDEYFSVLVEQKGLRNQESIEMLNIIKGTRSFDIGVAYQWIVKISEAMKSVVGNGSTDVASKIASNKSDAENKISDMLEAMAE